MAWIGGMTGEGVGMTGTGAGVTGGGYDGGGGEMTGTGGGVNWMEGYSGCGSAFGWGVLYLWERALGAREI